MQYQDKQIGEHETKFVLANNRAHVIINWLKKRCQPDPVYAKGKVSSIYYDTPDWIYLSEKVNSDYLKTKVRLRWYSDFTTGKPFPPTFFEVKSKTGSARKKLRIQTDIDSTVICNSDLNDPFLISLSQLAMEKALILKKNPVASVSD